MKEILAKSRRKESRNTRKPIFSQGLAGGPMPSSSRIGQPTSPSGQPLAPVNRFRAPVSDVARKTAGTYGQRSTASFQSINLTRCLANRLQAGMDLNGSMEYRLTWKKSVIESGRLIYRLRARARRSSDKGFGGWPAPMAGTPAQNGNSAAGNNDSSRRTVEIAKLVRGWPAPCQQDGPHGGPNQGTDRLPGAVATVKGWPAPRAREGDSRGAQGERFLNPERSNDLPDCADLIGVTTKLSGATSEQQEKDGYRGVLNPAFSLWLQGYPAGWTSLEQSATV